MGIPPALTCSPLGLETQRRLFHWAASRQVLSCGEGCDEEGGLEQGRQEECSPHWCVQALLSVFPLVFLCSQIHKTILFILLVKKQRYIEQLYSLSWWRNRYIEQLSLFSQWRNRYIEQLSSFSQWKNRIGELDQDDLTCEQSCDPNPSCELQS